MTRIVCDTMIWYYLSKGEVKIPDPKKYILVCTYLTLTELAFTPNNFKKLEQVQDAVRQILNSEPKLKLLHPFDHARTLVDKNLQPEFDIESDLVFGFLRVLINHSKDGLINNKFKDQLLDISTKRKENGGDWATFLNNLNEPSKEISRVLKKYHSEEWQTLKFKEWFVFQLNQLNDTFYTSDIINWNDFEFYEGVYKRYHRNLLISKMKADINDDNDLKNMIYVQPTNLYWTSEKRWKTIAKEANLEKYLYLE